MKNHRLKITIAVWVLVLAWSPFSWASLNVVTTTSDLASIAKEIGGTLIKINALIKGYQDAHFIQPKPSYMVKMNRADLLIYQGLELEIGWLPVLIEGSRNPEIRLGQPGHLDASEGISALQVSRGEVNRSMGDIHPYGNPHYNLDPENGFIIAQSIFNKLSELDPENTDQYKANLDRFHNKLKEKIVQWKSQMAPYRETKIVTYHRLWSYFAKRFELKVLDTVEVKPGVPPSTKHLAKLIAMINQHEIKLILQANYFRPQFSNIVAKKTGCSVLSLPVFVGGTPEIKDYFSLFDTIIEKLGQSLQSNSLR